MSTANTTIQAYELDGAWGVEEIADGPQRHHKGIPIQKDFIIYEAMFSETAAKRIAELYQQENPPEGWEETKNILVAEGFTEATISAPEASEAS